MLFNPRCALVLGAPKLLIPHCRMRHQFASKGNPFETKINLRRQVTDPSYPNFEKQECLKWTNWRMLRDVKRRYIVSEYWQERNNLMSLAHCETLPSVVREIALEERNSTPRDASINVLVNRCALSSRSRGRHSRYRISRNIWRDMADHGLVSGNIRAKWG